MDHPSGAAAQDQDRFRFFMKKHREMNEVFNGGDVRDRSGDRRKAICKKGKLFTPLCNRDIPVDRILVVDDI